MMEVEPSDLSSKLRWPSQCGGQGCPEEVVGESPRTVPSSQQWRPNRQNMIAIDALSSENAGI